MVASPKPSWWRRSVSPVAMTKVCPACKTAGPVRLQDGRLCAACEAQTAWSELGDGARLVIDHGSIAAALKRREGEAAGEPAWRRLAVWIAPAVTLAVAAIAIRSMAQLLSARALGPLGPLLDGLTSAAWWSTLGGLAALVAGTIALIRMRRRRHFRRLLLVASHGVAIIAGCSALVVGVVHAIGLRGGFGGQYTSMPVRESLGLPSSVERIVNATVVVLATDADGDARNLGLGTGAVIAADDTRAWIVTCSHVAMPYAAVGAWRHARDARPVWVQLSDGREGQATVRWTAPPPLDVALVELPIAHPPEPVSIAPDTAAIEASASMTFVPNPYRSGWKVLNGILLKRETHRTPAGTYDLLFTDLPVTFGDSGSGLYDARGQLVGLNTWTRIGGDGPSQGISLPSETMRVLVDAIHEGTLDKLDEARMPAEAPAAGATTSRTGATAARKD
jgi:S1-C subfamily serine protease/uncharacterized protein (DUF983 family)